MKTEYAVKKGWRLAIAGLLITWGVLILFDANRPLLGSLWLIGGLILLFLPDDVSKEE